MDANEDMTPMVNIDYGFCKYIGEDDMDLLQWYCINYNTELLDCMVWWLKDLDLNDTHIRDIFQIKELFIQFYQHFIDMVK